MAVFLHAAGFHCLTFDVRGHGANPAEELPLSAGEFGADTLARLPGAHRPARGDGRGDLRPLDGRRSGRSSRPPPTRASPRSSRPRARPDPYRLTRQTFRLARLPIPDPIAYPLAWLTTRVYLRPRGHVVAEVSATAAIARYDGPVLLAHGEDDAVVPAQPPRHGSPRRRARRGPTSPIAAPVETLIVDGGQHSWLYEDAGYRRTVGRLPGPGAGRAARPGDRRPSSPRRRPAERIPDGEAPFEAVTETAGRPADARPGRPARRDRPPARRDAATTPPTTVSVTGDPVWAAIASKRAIRAFADRPLDRRRTSSGSSTPAGTSGSSKNLQRWTFIVCRDREHLRELAGVGPWAGHLAGAAVAIALVTPDPRTVGRPAVGHVRTSGRRPRT